MLYGNFMNTLYQHVVTIEKMHWRLSKSKVTTENAASYLPEKLGDQPFVI